MPNVLDLIKLHEVDFSSGQRQIAKVICTMPNEVALYTIQDLGKKAGVSDASVLRFARKLGYSGFPELKTDLQKILMDSVTSWKRVERTLSDYRHSSSIIGDFVNKQIQFLSLMEENLSDSMLQAVAKAITKGQIIWIHGEGTAATPCNSLHFWLSRFGKDPRIITHSGRRLLDEVMLVDSSHVAILFSFGLPTRDAGILMEWMSERGVTTILITDGSDTKLNLLATHVLKIERGPMGAFHSMAVPVALADAIVISIARELGSSAVEAIRTLDDARTRYKL
jgi:DNA-binding MurR/RpiR family transcriptional regulator